MTGGDGMTGGATYGSDVIVDLLARAGIEHVAFNPGATFRGIHDSLVHRDGPEIVLCLHEAVSVAVAQGYAKAAGRPMAVLLHNVVGLQNASMAVYNAWCDRVPMLLIGGTGPLSKANRRPWIDWIHTAHAQAEIVRDYVKWDDQPHDMESVPESFARALHTATSAPTGPVYLCYDVALQEDEAPPLDTAELDIRGSYPAPTAPAPDADELDRLAGELRAARMPVLVTGYAGETAQGFRDLVELAETLHAPVIDTGSRLSFPTAHELNFTGLPEILDESDLIVVLDVDDPAGTVTGRPATVVNVTPAHLRLRGWAHDYQAYAAADRHLTATAGQALAGLLPRLRGTAAPEERRKALRGRVAAERRARTEAARTATADGAVPLERLLAELGDVLDGTPFVLAGGTFERLEHRLWDLREPGAALGSHGGGGLGYGLGASIGAALARPGVVTVDVQPDGDALFTPSALWTMAHLGTPVLVVMHNNRQYGNTVGHAAAIARHRGRPESGRYTGAGLADPAVDFAGLAASFGLWSAGPITDPAKLPGVLAEALAIVRSGRPALVDVVTPGP